MKRAIFLFLWLVACVSAKESPFPTTPPAEPAPDSVTLKKLGFFILDYGHPSIWGRPTNYWIGSAGRVYTQTFKRREDGKQDEIRYKYDLTPKQLNHLQRLLDSLRKDTRVLRERYGKSGEFAPTIAFSMRPHSDLYIREKWGGDLWKEFFAVTRFLSDVHRARTGAIKPTHRGIWDLGQAIWEPEGHVALQVIGPLCYIGSDRYNAVLDEKAKSEQDGAEQPATAPDSKLNDVEKTKPESEVRPE